MQQHKHPSRWATWGLGLGLMASALTGCEGFQPLARAVYADEVPLTDGLGDGSVVGDCSVAGSGDADGDGVCDVDDACVGEDDRIDGDADGLPDGCDDCPLDPDNDADGDGVCGDVDACLGFDDSEDEDADLVPNGCDDCPGDPINDVDLDGSCAVDDPCPEDADDTCKHLVTLGVQVDVWFEDARWELQSQTGTILNAGDFSAPYGGGFYQQEVPYGATVCVELFDTYGDGGMDGFLYNETSGREMLNWSAASYTTGDRLCADVDGPADPAAVLPYVESDWNQPVALCDVRISIDTQNWGSEVGWQLIDSRDNLVTSVPYETYPNYSSNNFTNLDLAPGDYIFRMLDSYGDGWNGATFEVGLVSTGTILASGTLAAGLSAGLQNVTVTCP